MPLIGLTHPLMSGTIHAADTATIKTLRGHIDMTRKTALTPNQVRQQMRQRGETLTQWAASRGFDRDAVYRVMNGRDKAHYGRAHEIAVALGLKVPEEEPNTPVTTRNMRRQVAA
jgi:gp16 family phage-associated protein